MSDWSAKQYTRFETERNRPIPDLPGALPPCSGRKAIDLGCGPGNSTEFLSACFLSAEVSAIDRSPDMIEAACKALQAIQSRLTG